MSMVKCLRNAYNKEKQEKEEGEKNQKPESVEKVCGKGRKKLIRNISEQAICAH